MNPAPDTAAELALVVAAFPATLGIVWVCESMAGRQNWDGDHPRRIIGRVVSVPRTRLVLECQEDSLGDEGWIGGLVVAPETDIISRWANANAIDLSAAAAHLLRSLPLLAVEQAESAEIYYRKPEIAEGLRLLAGLARDSRPNPTTSPTTPAATAAANGEPHAIRR